MYQIVAIASTQFTAEEVQVITQLNPGQDEDPAYLALRQKFQHMRALSKNIVNIYLMRIENGQVVFLLDDLDPVDGPALIGQIYEEPEDKVFAAVDSIQISDNVYTDEWGTFLLTCWRLP
jgi:hypothetical protein